MSFQLPPAAITPLSFLRVSASQSHFFRPYFQPITFTPFSHFADIYHL
jgi:hypothetical protein